MHELDSFIDEMRCGCCYILFNPDSPSLCYSRPGGPPADPRSLVTRATYDLDTWSKAAMYNVMHCVKQRWPSATLSCMPRMGPTDLVGSIEGCRRLLDTLFEALDRQSLARQSIQRFGLTLSLILLMSCWAFATASYTSVRPH
jgi:hypothetical protein